MIRIVEVGPRDGLQHDQRMITTEHKIALVNALSVSGVSEIEVTAFVSEKWIPQLADAEAVFAGITRNPNIIYSALVPNEQGMDRALAANVDKISVFTAATNTFNRKNINTDIAGSLLRFAPVIKTAKIFGKSIRGYVSAAFWCPYEGYVKPEQTVSVVAELLDLGVDEISIGDTIGKASPAEVSALILALKDVVASDRVAMHFHDTYGRAAANVRISLALGIVAFDSSVGGLGGCPYAPGAPGNIATSTLVEIIRDAGFSCDVKLDALDQALEIIRND